MHVNVTKVVLLCPTCRMYMTGFQTTFGRFMCSGCTNTVTFQRYAKKYCKHRTGVFAPGERPFK